MMPVSSDLQKRLSQSRLSVGDKFIIDDDLFPANIMTVKRIIYGSIKTKDKVFYTDLHWVFRDMCLSVSTELAERVKVL